MGMVFGKVDVACPDHQVIAKHSGWEVRRYVSYAIAEVQGSAKTQQEFGNQNFRILAKYIGVFGLPNNEQKQSMAMTAPVFSAMPVPKEGPMFSSSSDGQSNSHAMSFVLPKEYTIENAPKPNDARIQLRHIPPKTVAVHVFSGTAEETEVHKKAGWLIDQVKGAGYTLHSNPEDLPYKRGWELARYNPPFTLPLFRTNEIHVHLEDGAGSGENN